MDRTSRQRSILDALAFAATIGLSAGTASAQEQSRPQPADAVQYAHVAVGGSNGCCGVPGAMPAREFAEGPRQSAKKVRLSSPDEGGWPSEPLIRSR